MTESTTEEKTSTQVHMQATFHEENHAPEEITLTIADPDQPLIIISIGACPSGDDVIDIGLDVSGFKGPDQMLNFLEEMVAKMRATKAEQVLPDGTKVPYEMGQPEEAKPE